MGGSTEERIRQELKQDLEHRRLVLPTLPEVALKVREVIDDPDASMTAIARVIGTDAALSARLIQVANSPLMRATRTIETLDGAVSRLGMKLVRELVTSLAMAQMFQATTDATDKRLRALWEHSTQVAAISHALASRFTKLKPEQAMLAGLVHDIGSLPILAKAEEYPELLEDEAALDQVINGLHASFGRAILEAWNFPQELVDVPEGHEDLTRQSAAVDYVDVVTVANLQSYLGTDHPCTRLDWSRIPAFAKLGLSPEVNVIELGETADQIREVRSLLAS
jgi:putative nucleotidyltransferase with HDIG domain